MVTYITLKMETPNGKYPREHYLKTYLKIGFVLHVVLKKRYSLGLNKQVKNPGFKKKSCIKQDSNGKTGFKSWKNSLAK